VAVLTDEEAEAVRKWLEHNQFVHASSRPDDPSRFGDHQDVWERDGTLLRLTRDRLGQWWCDLSRNSAVWLEVDRVARAVGSRSGAPVERVAEIATTMNDAEFGALIKVLPHSP
jgi:hypothetical protein